MATTKIPAEFLAANTIVSLSIAENIISTRELAANGITSAQIASNAILTRHIDDNQITGDQIADNSVGTPQLAGIARGKIIVGDASGNPALLSLGSSGYVLKSDGSDIAWAEDADTAALTSEQVQDIAGAMFSSNTETGIAATYQDGDGTIDLVIGANVIVAGMIAQNSILTRHIDDDQVTGAQLADALTVVTSVTTPLVDAAIVDGENFKVNGGQGSDGQVLTSTGSGVAWEAAGVAGIVSSADATAITIGSDENVTFAQNISSVNNLYVADDIGHAGDSDTYMSFENDYLGFYTGGVNTLVLNNGNVGIGVTAPTGVLAITATDTSNKPQVRFMTTGATNLADAALSTTDDSGGTNLLIGSNQYYSGGSIARFSTDRSGTAIDFGYTGNMKFFTGSGSSAPTERMRVLATGSVSISNDGSVPHSSSKFHVKGTALTMSDSAGNAGGGFQTFSGTKSITGTTAVTIFSLSRTNGAHTGIVMITKSDSGDSAAGIFSFSANYDAAASLSAMNTSVAGYTGFTLSTVVNGNGITFKLAHGNAGTTKNYTYTVLYGGSVNVGTPTLY